MCWCDKERPIQREREREYVRCVCVCENRERKTVVFILLVFNRNNKNTPPLTTRVPPARIEDTGAGTTCTFQLFVEERTCMYTHTHTHKNIT